MILVVRFNILTPLIQDVLILLLTAHYHEEQGNSHAYQTRNIISQMKNRDINTVTCSVTIDRVWIGNRIY
jgi:hypothetical protein